MKKSVTINDIARELSISRNTVSKALNGQYVKKETKELIVAKAKELNYKSLGEIDSTKKDVYKIVLISGKPLSNFNYFVPIIKSIENYCFENGYTYFHYVIRKFDSSLNTLKTYIDGLDKDGIVCIEAFDKEVVKKIINLKVPVCFIDCCSDESIYGSNIDIVNTTDRTSISTIVTKLIKTKKIQHFSFVGDPNHCQSFKNRYTGMVEALFLNDIHHTKECDILLNENFFDYGDIGELKNVLFKLKNKTQCYICSNDFIAMNVINALKQLNVVVPQDALVVGYDNAEQYYSYKPSITTVGLENQTLGTIAIETLVNRIKNPSTPSKHINVNTKIFYRDSTN